MSFMAQTKSALLFGGIHQQSFNQGLSSFFFSVRLTASGLMLSTSITGHFKVVKVLGAYGVGTRMVLYKY